MERGTRREWVGLGEASRMLGVAPATLRRWTDAGRVDSFVTPGGHRRYRRTSLDRLAPPERAAARPPAVRSMVTRSRLARAYRSEAREVARSLPWVDALDDAQRTWFRERGRLMVAALLAHLDADDREVARHQLVEARTIAAGYGRVTSSLGVSLSDALEGFLQFRRPFLGELERALRQRDVDLAASAAVTGAAERAMDALLVAAVTAHTVVRAGAPRRAAARRAAIDKGTDASDRTGTGA